MWEYHTHMFNATDKISDTLNKFGRDSWELIAVLPSKTIAMPTDKILVGLQMVSGQIAVPQEMIFIFKRKSGDHIIKENEDN